MSEIKINPSQPRDLVGRWADHPKAATGTNDPTMAESAGQRYMPDLLELTEATREVLDTISAAGGRPYLVGGCVRDALISPGQIPKDVDIEVFGLNIDDLSESLEAVGHVDDVGKEFSVLKMSIGSEDFDISLPRREVKTADGHRGFAVEADPNSTLKNASARRDFTINSMMFDPQTGMLIDSWGGMDDLKEGVLRHTTEAFSEDPLRVLRGVQFSARFGYTMHPNTAALCQELSHTYAELPTERVWEEWHKIAAKGTHISAALATLQDTVWEKHYPELSVLHGVEQDSKWHPEGNVHIHSGLAADKASEMATAAGLGEDDRTVIVLAAMLHDFGKATHTQHTVDADGNPKITSHGHAEAGVEPAVAFLNRIGASKAVRDRVKPLIREHMCAAGIDQPTKSAVRRLARRLAPATVEEWAMVSSADKGGRGSGSIASGTEKWTALFEQEEDKMTPLLNGKHLIDAGMKPGPAFKPVLAAALEAQDNGEFNDEAGALHWFSAHTG